MEKDLAGLQFSDSPLKTFSDVDDDVPAPFDVPNSITPVMDNGRVPTIGNLNELFDWKQTIPQPLLQSNIMAKHLFLPISIPQFQTLCSFGSSTSFSRVSLSCL